MTDIPMLFENIDISRLDTADDLFQLDHPNDRLLNWDTNQPLYNPVWLQRKGPDAFRIVDGFRVVRTAASATTTSSIPARVFPEDSNLLQLWEQRVQKRILENNLSAIAWLKGLSRLMTELRLEAYSVEMAGTALPPGIKTHALERHELDRILEKSGCFERFTSIHQLEYQQLEKLAGYDSNVLTDIGILLDGMQLKGKKLSSLLELVQELSRGYGIQTQDLRSDKELSDIRRQYQPHQRYRHIKARLLTLRYPRLSQLLADWNETLKNTGLKETVDIRHDPYFEGEHLEFVFSAQNTRDLEQRLQTLLSRIDSPGLKRLFDFI